MNFKSSWKAVYTIAVYRTENPGWKEGHRLQRFKAAFLLTYPDVPRSYNTKPLQVLVCSEMFT